MGAAYKAYQKDRPQGEFHFESRAPQLGPGQKS
jgi:hypothetical protein